MAKTKKRNAPDTTLRNTARKADIQRLERELAKTNAKVKALEERWKNHGI